MAVARSGSWTLAALILLGIFQHAFCSLPAFGGGGRGAVAAARKEDIKYLKCAVCEELVKQLARQVKQKREELLPKKVTELQIIDLAENICNLKKEESEWINYLDIVQEGDALKLLQKEEEGECKTKCKTIERTCQEVMGDHDTDVAEFIYKTDAQRAALFKLLCKDLSKACIAKPPPVPKGRNPGEPFVPKSSKDADISKLMRSMSDMPGSSGMKIYSKDDVAKMRSFSTGDEDEDEDEDEDDDQEVPKIPGKITSAEKAIHFKNQVLQFAQQTRQSFNRQTRYAVRKFRKIRNQGYKLLSKWLNRKQPYKSTQGKAKAEKNQGRAADL